MRAGSTPRIRHPPRGGSARNTPIFIERHPVDIAPGRSLHIGFVEARPGCLRAEWFRHADLALRIRLRVMLFK
jgi:hypothetical protein